MHYGGGGVANREQRSRSRSRRGGVSENWIVGAAAARLFFLTAVAIVIATRPFKFHEISVSNMSSSFVSSFTALHDSSVADPDPGSAAFLTLGSGMGKKSGSGMNNPDNISEILETFFQVKILKSIGRGLGFWIREKICKHPGSATLVRRVPQFSVPSSELGPFIPLKGLSYEIDFENIDENGQILA